MRLLQWNIGPSRTPSSYAFERVVIPLEDAHLHSYSARMGTGSPDLRAPRNGDADADPDVDDADDSGKDVEHEETGMLEMSVSEYSVEGLRREVRKGTRGIPSEYELRSKVVNKAIQDIGMGRYNWQLFVLCGFGWFADNLWLQGISLTLPSLSAEFGVDEKTRIWHARIVCAELGMGLLLYGALGFGVGGNLPVDGALFLEFLPDASSSLLTLLSVWWPIGQLVASLVAWFYIANWPADEGWRYFIFATGVLTFIMFLVRYFVFHLFESPKFLLSQGRYAEAVAVVQGIAFKNGARTWLTLEVLDAVASDDGGRAEAVSAPRVSAANVVLEKLRSFSGERLRPLFSSRKLGLATGLLWFCWATIGMGYPLFNAFLPQYLSHGGNGSGGASEPAGPTGSAASLFTREARRRQRGDFGRDVPQLRHHVDGGSAGLAAGNVPGGPPVAVFRAAGHAGAVDARIGGVLGAVRDARDDAVAAALFLGADGVFAKHHVRGALRVHARGVPGAGAGAGTGLRPLQLPPFTTLLPPRANITHAAQKTQKPPFLPTKHPNTTTIMSGALSLMGWWFLPPLVASWTQSIWYALTIRAGDPKPAPNHPAGSATAAASKSSFYTALGLSPTPPSATSSPVSAASPPSTTRIKRPRLPAADGSEFIRLKTAADTLLGDASRFAYDRFGDPVLAWKDCASRYEYAFRGTVQGVLPITSATPSSTPHHHPPFLYLARPPQPRPRLPLSPPPPLLPFQLVSLARRLCVTFYIALSQIGPLLFPPTRAAALAADADKAIHAQVERLTALAADVDDVSGRLLDVELAPFKGDPDLLRSVRAKVADWLVQNTIRADPMVKDAMGHSFRKRRADAPAGAKGNR
ncbi:unnamed protein product [Parascedosporium putredinis]|uniref:J domain-containing protein n=1 Tax=Parascedosporium putredinis TaxID=1442378 RepID=A0A9P1GXP1_9PEZI|nr:unnamed protein product [Parascedosporium putredinis]CAI7990011.1 unnamed protein product [Parascedosporium putredinis]